MYETLNNLLHEHMYLHILLICLCVGGMLVAMAVDLFFGIKKAKHSGWLPHQQATRKLARKDANISCLFPC